MPPLPMSSRISSCGNSGASSATLGGWNAGCFASVMVSSAAPILSRQAGQNPASAPVGSGVPHCGQWLASGIGGFIFTVSMPTSEAKPAECYRKNLGNIQQPTLNAQHSVARIWRFSMFNVECFPPISPQLEAAPVNHLRRDHREKHHAHQRVQPEEREVDPV